MSEVENEQLEMAECYEHGGESREVSGEEKRERKEGITNL